MKKNRTKMWIILTIVSVLLLAAAIVFLFVFLLPMIGKGKLLDAFARGDEEAVEEYFEDKTYDEQIKLRDELKEEVREIVVYTHNQYMDQKKTYDELYAVYETVEDVRSYEGMTEPSFAIIQIPKLTEFYETGVKRYLEVDYPYSDEEYKKASDNFYMYLRIRRTDDDDSLYYNWQDTEREAYDKAVETALDSVLMEKFAAYSAGNLDINEAQAYIDTAVDFWGSDYAYQLSRTIEYELTFRQYMADVEESEEEKSYFYALGQIDSIVNNYKDVEEFAEWEQKFADKKTQLEKNAKDYYVAKAIEANQEGDFTTADYLVQELKNYFGQDFDTTEIDAARPAEWIAPYIDFMDNWEAELSQDYKDENLDEVKPTRVFLEDLDGNGTPELCLYGEAKTIFVYTYYDGMVTVEAAARFVYGLGPDNEIITGGTVKNDGVQSTIWNVWRYKCREGYSDYDFATHSISGDEHRYNIGVHNGEKIEVDEATYLAKKQEMVDLKARDLPEGASVSDYEEYIRSWK